MIAYSSRFGIYPIFDVETRIKRRIDPSIEMMDGFSKASALKRQKHTLEMIVTHQEVWTVWDGNQLPTYETEGNPAMDIWPYKKAAELFHRQDVCNPQFVPIPLDDWINEILFTNNTDPVDISYFPSGNKKQVMVSDKDEFLRLVQNEWTNQYGVTGQVMSEGEWENHINKNMLGSLQSKPKGNLP